MSPYLDIPLCLNAEGGQTICSPSFVREEATDWKLILEECIGISQVPPHVYAIDIADWLAIELFVVVNRIHDGVIDVAPPPSNSPSSRSRSEQNCPNG